ncbi:MAG: LacI family DNA-binding transcriptional regulator [Anaerolineae bacterium]|nr:LacI family DNA-binding transcriptional regulator [Anaerolineae bacterium]
MSRRVTMADVAREAGVSQMTVSRVVNEKGDISEATSLRIREVIQRLGYRPSGVARSLATKRTGTLGLVVPDNSNPCFSAIARGAEHVAYQEGYSIFLCNTEEETDRELAVIRSLEEKGVDGTILCSSRLGEDDLRRAISYIPCLVLVNRRLEQEGIGFVVIDDERSGRIATRHLLDAGHRAIAMLAGPINSYAGQQRTRGYRAAMQAAGLKPEDGWVLNCPPRIEGSMQATRELLSAHSELTALVCYNDLVAIGALKACAEMSLSVPDEIAVVGHDDIPLSELVTPALTTCRVSQYEMGSQAVQLLLKHIGGCETECHEVIFQSELIVRASAP